MAKVSNKAAAMFFNLVLMISVLLIFSMAEGRLLSGFGKAKATSPKCEFVVGVQSGDTCFDITQKFNTTAEFFTEINPNLQCDKLFVGQWLCVAGTVN
ncbi:Peptidoglycan-binding lysin domain [Macleaya cordata]|uniref:Peptidoglycan-binding lysin domain n=1 Tax=Macleaya cordata TaxID=56857 RepID=A0A200QC57_MACCD|nr:Peptidoglycan-binding lysin domain [Macleaya cordata]